MDITSCDIVYSKYSGVESVSDPPEKEFEKSMPYDMPDQISSSDNHPSGIRIRLGTRMKTGEPVCWLPEDARQSAANLAVVGGENTDNTQMVHSVAIQLLRQKAQAKESVSLLLFVGMDDSGDSHTNFPEISGAQVLRLHRLPFNPLSLSCLERKPQLHTHMAMVFADSLARAYGLGALEKSILVQSVISAYASRGITSDPLTWNLPAPSLEDVYEEYCARPQSQRSDTLAQILENLSALELFDPDTAPEEPILNRFQGTVMIDMAGYPESLKFFVLDMMLDVLEKQIHGRERTLGCGLRNMILIENADRLLLGGCPGLEELLTRGSQFGLGVLLSVHSMDAFQVNRFDCSQHIRTWVLHNVEDLRKTDLEFLLRADIPDSELDRLYQESRHLRKLHSLIFPSDDTPILAEDLPFYEIAGDTAQSYLISERTVPDPKPMAGMPLLDFDDLGTLDEDIPGPMGLFDGL